MANNIDRLFRENLDQFEVTPAAQSWNEVQGRLATKNKKGAWWVPISIAAAITLMIVASIMLLNTKQSLDTYGRIVSIDYPVAQQQLQLTVELPYQENQHLSVSKTPQEQAKSQPASRIATETLERATLEVLTVASIQKIQLDVDLPAVSLKQSAKAIEPELPQIKITYIASNQAVDSKTRLGDLINSLSRDVSPSDFLADIRDAKDNLLSKN